MCVCSPVGRGGVLRTSFEVLAVCMYVFVIGAWSGAVQAVSYGKKFDGGVAQKFVYGVHSSSRVF